MAESTTESPRTDGAVHHKEKKRHDTSPPHGNVNDAPLAAASASASGVISEAAVQDIQQFLAGEQANSRGGPDGAVGREMLLMMDRDDAQNLQRSRRDVNVWDYGGESVSADLLCLMS